MSKIELEDENEKFVEVPCGGECDMCETTLDTCKLTKPEQIIEDVSNLLLPILAGIVGLIVICIVCGIVLWCKKCMNDEKAKTLPKLSNVHH